MSSFVVAVNPIGWLRNARFDLTLIVGVALLALTAGALVVLQPHWFYVLLALDLWLLGYPHVIATFTRLSFDMDSFRQNKYLVLGLPWIICAGTVAMGYFLGFWAVATTYLYWQWFHYTRQSYGIMRFYYRKSGPGGAVSSGVHSGSVMGRQTQAVTLRGLSSAFGNVFLALLFALFAYVHARSLLEVLRVSVLLILVKEILDAVFYLTRRTPESYLSQDPAYVLFMERTRWRLIPYVL
jgi:hypothetical protein